MKIDVSAVLAGLLVPAFAAAQPASPAPSPAPPEPPVAAPTPDTSVDEPPPGLAPAVPPVPPQHAVSSAPEAAPPPRALDRPSAARIGAELAVLPVGTLTLDDGSDKASFDAEPTLGVGAVLQIPFSEVFTIDLAPRVVFNVKSKNDTDSATELDLRVRLTAGGEVSPGARLYAALQPAYSFVFLPIDPPPGVEMSAPSGLAFGLAAGAVFRVSPGVHVTSEVGYQFGFQSTTISGPGGSLDLGVTASFLHFAGGVLLDL